MDLNNQIVATPKPLALSRNDNLKIFAVSCVSKDVPVETIKDKCVLTIIATYTLAEAIMGAKEAVRQFGKDPDTYTIPFLIIGKDAKELIDLTLTRQTPKPFVPIEARSAKTLSYYVRYVFDRVGSVTQKKVAEDVIKKFLEYANKNKN